MRVNITRAFAFNPTGYAAKADEYAVGAQDVPEKVAAWLGRHPAFGSLVSIAEGEPNEGVEVPLGGVGEITEDGDRVLIDEEAAAVEFPEGELEGQPPNDGEAPAEEGLDTATEGSAPAEDVAPAEEASVEEPAAAEKPAAPKTRRAPAAAQRTRGRRK